MSDWRTECHGKRGGRPAWAGVQILASVLRMGVSVTEVPGLRCAAAGRGGTATALGAVATVAVLGVPSPAAGPAVSNRPR